MVTRDSPYLTIDIFIYVAVKIKFLLLSLVWYLFNVVSGNKHPTGGSNGNALSITTITNVFVARWVLPLVTGLCYDSLSSLNSVTAI